MSVRQMDLFSPKKRRLQDYLIVLFSYQAGWYRDNGARLFLEKHSKMKRPTNQAATWQIPSRNKGKKYYSEVGQPIAGKRLWNVPSMMILKTQLGKHIAS